MACIFHELIFTDAVDIAIEEGSELRLQFEEPAPPGNYEDIRWYKGSTNGDGRIVHFSEDAQVFNYYGDYCSSSSPCDVSDKGELDIRTGTFTFHQVQLNDDDYYYYHFYPGDTGHKYEYSVEVYGRFIMILQGCHSVMIVELPKHRNFTK